MRIALGRLHLAVAQQLANHLERGPAADQQGSKGVAQIMNANSGQLGIPLDVDPEPADFLDGLTRNVAGEQPWIALGHEQLALAHDGRNLGRNRDAVDLALLGAGGGL